MELKIYQKADDSEVYRLVGGGEYPRINTLDSFMKKIDLAAEPGFIERSSWVAGDVVEVREREESSFHRFDGQAFQKCTFDPAAADSSAVMEVVYVAPNEYARSLILNKSLPSMQNAVAGWIEFCYPWSDSAAIIANDEGKINGMELNRALRDENGKIIDVIAGPFLIVGLTEDDCCSLSSEQMERYKMEFHQPERFLNLDGVLIAYKFNPAQSVHL